MATTSKSPTCFIAMPITAQEHEIERYGDPEHWSHVMETLFVPAIEAAGYTARRPKAVGSHLIHGEIIKHLSSADLVLCDLSGHNPNVFFELGVRTSLNLPIALVRDEHTDLPFDTAGINTHPYKSTLNGWDVGSQTRSLREHIETSVGSCNGTNPLWRQFGLSISASEPGSTEGPEAAKLDLLLSGMREMRQTLDRHEDQQDVVRAALDLNLRESDRVRHSAGKQPDLSMLPSEQFVEALRARPLRGIVGMEESGAREVIVRIGHDTPLEVEQEIMGLASVYGVRALLEPVDNPARFGDRPNHTKVYLGQSKNISRSTTKGQ